LVRCGYAFGHSLQGEASRFLEACGGKVVGSVRFPFGTLDSRRSYCKRRLRRPKVIGLAMSGADLLNGIKQACEFGIVQSDQSRGEVSDVVDLADTPKSQVTVLIHRANGTSDRIRFAVAHRYGAGARLVSTRDILPQQVSARSELHPAKSLKIAAAGVAIDLRGSREACQMGDRSALRSGTWAEATAGGLAPPHAGRPPHWPRANRSWCVLGWGSRTGIVVSSPVGTRTSVLDLLGCKIEDASDPY
jgi:hypothetical protein